MASEPVFIGELRWYVTLAMRREAPTFGHTGISESIVPIANVYASIEPMGLQSFLYSEQIESPITHLVHIRWQPFENLEMFNIIQRTILLPDNTERIETYRIRRVQEWQGRHRFIRMDVELEKYV